LVGDNGSMEDLITDPPLSTADHPECTTGCFAQVEATGTKIADEVAARLGNAMAVPIGAVGGRRTAFCVPLENNLFRALAQAGIFGEPETYASPPTARCQPAVRSGQH